MTIDDLVDLRREFARLQKQLRANERIWSGFRRLEIQMIGARSLAELVDLLSKDLPALFPRVDAVSIACIDPEYELMRLLDEQSGDNRTAVALIPIDEDALKALFSPSMKPRLGACPEVARSSLFRGYHGAVASVALAPLVLRGRLVGSLNQASRDPTHFSPASSTDLLEHLAAVVAMCLDSAVNQERLKQDGLSDPLTGIANRRFFERRLADELERARREVRPLVCLLIDVDYFKHVNDRFGHQAGDAVLKAIAELLDRRRRASDVLARYGGEEFILLLPATDSGQGAAIAERLRADVEALRPSIAGEQLTLTVSIGVACLAGDAAPHAASMAPLVAKADSALYLAKTEGRNRIFVASD